MILYIEAIAGLLSLLGLSRNIQKKADGYLIWAISGVGFTYTNFNTQQYIQMIVWAIFILTDIAAYFQWKRVN